ncbi:MAG: dihydrolipoamide acetyltransferase [Fusobacterium sp.]
MKKEVVKTLTFAKGGKLGVSAKVIIPKEWVNDMEVTPDTLVKMSYNEEDKKILIEKLEK